MHLAYFILFEDFYLSQRWLILNLFDHWERMLNTQYELEDFFNLYEVLVSCGRFFFSILQELLMFTWLF